MARPIMFEQTKFIMKEYQNLHKEYKDEAEYHKDIQHLFNIARRTTRALQRESALITYLDDLERSFLTNQNLRST